MIKNEYNKCIKKGEIYVEKYYNGTYEYLLEQNKGHMNEIALSFEDREITYEEFHDKVGRYEKLLYDKGVRKGDKIGISAFNTPEGVFLWYALKLIGATTVGFNPIDKKEQIKCDLEISRPKMVVTVDMNYSKFHRCEKALDFTTMTYSPVECFKGVKAKLFYGAAAFLQNGIILPSKKIKRLPELDDLQWSSHNDYNPEQAGEILFTGGSSGTHKAVRLYEHSFNAVADGMEAIFKAEPGMVHLGQIPFCNMAYGRSILHYALSHNMKYALTLKAMPRDFYAEIVRTHANAAVGGPVHWTALVEKQPDGTFKINSEIKPGSLTELHYATSGGEALKPVTVEPINNALRYGGSDALIGDALGATEAAGPITINYPKKHGSGNIGEPISTVKIYLKDGETLCVSGPTVMKEYYGNQEETNSVIVYHDGDRYVNLKDNLSPENISAGEDNLTIYKYNGREKRNFVSGCDNIYPEQLEALLCTLPNIREAVVTPISDEQVQYLPRYHISLIDSTVDEDQMHRIIVSAVKQKFNEFWLPGSIAYYSDPLERMTNGKLDIQYYRQLDKEALDNNLIAQSSEIEAARHLRLQKM